MGLIIGLVVAIVVISGIFGIVYWRYRANIKMIQFRERTSNYDSNNKKVSDDVSGLNIDQEKQELPRKEDGIDFSPEFVKTVEVKPLGMTSK